MPKLLRFLVSAAASALRALGRGSDLLPPRAGWSSSAAGWARLSVAAPARRRPELEVVVVEPQPSSGPTLSNRWLAGLIDGKLLTHRRAAARAFGYNLVQAEVTSRHRPRPAAGPHRPGAPSPTTGSSSPPASATTTAPGSATTGAATDTCRHFPAAFTGRDEILALKAKLRQFQGGDLVMTVPPMPYRCPPAPTSGAAMIGWLLKTRGVKGRLHVLDPNPITLGFDKIFRHDFADQISYRPTPAVKAVDPHGKTISTEFDTIPSTTPSLLYPQQAGDLVWQMGLEARGGDGKPTGWAAQIRCTSRRGRRAGLPGGRPHRQGVALFGRYPKTGHLAARLGRIAALEIAAGAAAGSPLNCPKASAHVIAKPEPREMMRVETHYRFRGDVAKSSRR